ncbi:MAG: 3-hydroxyacyl-ACP dehydratase FabZ [Peptococcaceae bacterium]|nr:3-hydroxyacyl-ACP dehydratase FabZ [Peptococcaceae bacterium]
MNSHLNTMDSQAIQKIIPHRYPFLLVDRIESCDPGKRAVGIKNVTVNEPFFQGHFPGYPIMPGVLILEALAQVGAVALLVLPEYAGKIALFGGLKNARFRRPVVPGDVLRLEVEIQKIRAGIGVGSGVATVDGRRACEGEMTFRVGDE